MKIYQTNQFPKKQGNEVIFIEKDNFALELGDKTFYGFRDEEQVEQALKLQPVRSFSKRQEDYEDKLIQLNR